MESTASASSLDVRYSAPPPGSSLQSPDALLRALAIATILMKHRDSSFCVKDLARDLHVSVRHLHRCFAGRESVGRLISRTRATTAAMLLSLEPTASDGEIAQRAGFSHPATMRAHLHRYIGRTPRELRLLQSVTERSIEPAQANSPAQSVKVRGVL